MCAPGEVDRKLCVVCVGVSLPWLGMVLSQTFADCMPFVVNQPSVCVCVHM